MSILKIFIPNIVSILKYERYKTYLTGFSFCRLGRAPGVGLWGTGGTQGVKPYQIDGEDEWDEVKGQISLNFGYHVNFKDFYTKYCVYSRI